MFESNDKPLFTAKTILAVSVAICAALILICGIVSAVVIHWACVFIIPFGWFFCWVAWIFIKLFLSFLCDVKLIRNKLYKQSDARLTELFVRSAQASNLAQTSYYVKVSETEQELLRLKQLLKSGVIDEQEYEERRSKVINRNNQE